MAADVTPAMTAHQAQLAQELRDEEAARRWSEGHVTADRVTAAVDVSGIGFLTALRLVSRWGKYPTWEQLVELAQLCDIEPLRFTQD